MKPKELKKAISKIDFNFNLTQDALENGVLDYASSVNINALDLKNIKSLISAAKEKNVVVGALLEIPKGYKIKKLSDNEIEEIIFSQLGVLNLYAKACGAEIEQVRLSDEFLSRFSVDFDFACKIMDAVKFCSPWLNFIADMGQVTQRAADFAEIMLSKELFLGKIYNPDATVDNSVAEISDEVFNLNRLQKFVTSAKIYNNKKDETEVSADTIHFTSVELIKKAAEIIIPTPLNFNKAALSGWVG